MSKARWKKWPEVQHRIAVHNDNGFRILAQIRCYTEEGGNLTAHQAEMEIGSEHLSEACLGELKGKLRSVVESYQCTLNASSSRI
jgi:hypothetical protein